VNRKTAYDFAKWGNFYILGLGTIFLFNQSRVGPILIKPFPSDVTLLKGLVHPNISHPHVIPNPMDLRSTLEHK